MNFNLIIFEGTKSIKFGMTSDEIQNILKIKPTLFKKTEVDLYETEEYENICHVYYEEKNGKIVSSAFEFIEPSKVLLDNTQLMGENRQVIENLFKKKFEDCEIDPYRFGSPNSEIFVSLTFESKILSVFIARKGYGQSQKEFYEKAFG